MSKKFWATPRTSDANLPSKPRVLKIQRGQGTIFQLREQVYGKVQGNPSPPLTSSQGDFLASLSPLPGSDEARQMTATSGQRCYASYERFIPAGSLRRMCQALMTQPIWSSILLHLTWKGSVTQRFRLKFRLVPLAPRTEGSECGLWPTPDTVSAVHPGMVRTSGGQTHLPQAVNASLMWPTPNLVDYKITGDRKSLMEYRKRHQDRLPLAVASKEESWNQNGGQLNPTWVEWLMGFPLGWTALEPSEMLSSRKSRKRL